MKTLSTTKTLAVLTIGVGCALPPQAKAQRIPNSIVSPYFRDKTVNLNISNNGLAGVVEALGRESKANILTDSYVRDFLFAPGWDADGVPLGEFEQTLSEPFVRDLFKSGDIAVMKSPAPLFNLDLNAPLRERMAFKQQTPVLLFAGDGSLLTAPPAQPATAKVGIRATDVPIGELLNELQTRVGWKIELAAPFRERHVNLYLSGVTISDFADALAVLTNSTATKSKARVELVQSLQQKQQDAESEVRDEKIRNLITKSGAATMMKQLYRLLSNEQLETIKEEGHLEIPLSSLSASTQKDAVEYIKAASKWIEARGVPLKVGTNYDEFSLILSNRPMNDVTIDGIDAKGNPVAF